MGLAELQSLDQEDRNLGPPKKRARHSLVLSPLSSFSEQRSHASYTDIYSVCDQQVQGIRQPILSQTLLPSSPRTLPPTLPSSPPASTSLEPPLWNLSPLPLTKANLQKLDSSPGSQATSQKNSSTMSKSSSSESVGAVRRVLEQNRLFINDRDAEIRGQKLIDEARSILKGFRRSAMSREQAVEAKKTVGEYATRDELTFLVNLWTILLNGTRQLREESAGPMTAAEEEDAINWIKRAWKEDGVDANWSSPFPSNSIPPISPTNDVILDKLLALTPKVKNPKPDLTYGISKNAFSELEQAVNAHCSCSLTNGLWHEFFLVEAKSAGKPIEEAENQCCRAGSALVFNRRKFNLAAMSPGKSRSPQKNQTQQQLTPNSKNENPSEASSVQPSTYPRPDMSSFAFSLAVAPITAIMSVHWAEERSSDTVVWHMTDLEMYSLRKLEDYAVLRHDIDNVLDWGCGKRKRDIEETCKEIAKLIPAKSKRKREESSEQIGQDD